MIVRRGVCLVVAAPSGGGKSSLIRALLRQDAAVSMSVSVTTRTPRAGEADGVDYHFVAEPAFDRMAQSGELLEWAGVFGRFYGTPRAPVEQALAHGRDMVFDIDWQGFRQLRASLGDDVVGVFLLPPSLAALEARLCGRGDADPDEIARRMAQARAEIQHCAEFDHVVVNDVFERTLESIRAVLAAERCATRRQIGLSEFVGSL